MTSWQPACDLKSVQIRARLLRSIREFFAEKDVLEVETPLLCHAIGTDPHLEFFSSEYKNGSLTQTLYLQTSPEFAMKRLLAAGSGSIFQICKAFRNGEFGRFHNPEFTLLEYYRVDFDLNALMDEVIELLINLFEPYRTIKNAQKISYQQLFLQTTGLDPLNFSLPIYQNYAKQYGLDEAIELCLDNYDLWLDFIFSHQIQPTLTDDIVYCVYGYPASQASLARINTENPVIADRFEVFINGVELGNGFFELNDANEQQRRFETEIAVRNHHGLAEVKKDRLFLDALKSGLPDCSGIAIGLDRLLMLITQTASIENVLAFPLDRA